MQNSDIRGFHHQNPNPNPNQKSESKSASASTYQAYWADAASSGWPRQPGNEAMIGRVDIEESKSNVAMNAWHEQRDQRGT